LSSVRSATICFSRRFSSSNPALRNCLSLPRWEIQFNRPSRKSPRYGWWLGRCLAR
jgi:hypothetical protein